jgi:homoserine dehydrogenase
MADEAQCEAKRLCVLKFGSSVLRREEDYPAVALEIYRHVREGEKVVAVVSALAGETDRLLEQAERVGGGGADGLVARLARVGELQSAALMALALSRAGVRACTLDPNEMGLVAEGAPLDSDLTGLDAAAFRARLDTFDVVVVPGFTAGHREHGVVTLGRGGTDLSAVFFAARLDAHRVRLIKDVDGVYAEDPARNPAAERFSEMSYAQAAEASSGLIQPKAIAAAEAEDVLIEVAALGSAEATTIAHLPARKARPPEPERLRVALLGCGAVGGGVLGYLNSRPDLFELNPVLVRRPGKYSGPARFTAQPAEALAGKPDLVIELLGGADEPADLMRSALRHGAHVVTANKAAVANHHDSLHACAEAGGGSLRYSAAVGGSAPVLEALKRLDGSVLSVEGVMNGTCNFLLSRLGDGWSFEEAVERAQALGYAEADPSADVDSHDAAAKLSILVREAFGVSLPPARITKQSLRDVTPGEAQEALRRGRVLKQVGRCRLLSDGSLDARIVLEALDHSHPLAQAHNEENRFLITDRAGLVHEVFGKGAGRWPTATAVFADVMDAQRALLGRTEEPASEPVRLRA